MWQYHPILLAFALGTLLSGALAAYCTYRVWHQGRFGLVASFGALAAASVFYNGGALLKVASTALPWKVATYKLEIAGYVFFPAIMIVLTMVYLGYDRWITRGLVGTLGSISVGWVGLVLLNPGEVIIQDPVLFRADGIVTLEHAFPPLFVFLLAWLYLPFLGAAALLAERTVNGAQRPAPTLLVIVALFLPLGVSLLKVLRVYPPDGMGLNITPAFLSGSIILIGVAVFRFRLFDLLPVGRSRAFDVMQDGYLLTNAEGRIVDANPAARRLLERDGAPVRGRRASEVVPGGTGKTTDAPALFSVGERVLERRVSAVHDDGQLAGRVVLLRDVTPLHAQRRKLERENDRLERFVGIVSHDLRNPLNVATGRLERARTATDAPDLTAAAQALDRMRQLIDDLLLLAREGTAIAPDDMAPVALASLVHTCWDHVDTRRAALRVHTNRTLRAVERRLQQLLENLIRNAVEHGGPQVTVTVGDCPDGFYVADDGPGIPPDARSVVTESGYSTRPDGTGFGLAVVQEIAKAHDWSLSVGESDSGGARFVLRGVDDADAAPPYARGDAASQPAPAPPAAAHEPTAADEDRTTVLVVDDNVHVRRYVCDVLGDAYHVLEAADGQRGLERARSALPDVIVSDVMMPERDGVSLVEALRAGPPTDCLPVVLLTARADADDRAAGLSAGADAYLAKPFDAEVLRATVHRLLEARRRLRRRLLREGEVGPGAASVDAADAEATDAEATDAEATLPASAPAPFAERVRDALQAHLSDPDFTVQALAEAVAYSRPHMTEKVKETFGVSPSQLLRQKRLEHGAHLLTTTDATVTEIAYAVGFNSLSYFSRCFKEHYDRPPTAYRSAHT